MLPNQPTEAPVEACLGRLAAEAEFATPPHPHNKGLIMNYIDRLTFVDPCTGGVLPTHRRELHPDVLPTYSAVVLFFSNTKSEARRRVDKSLVCFGEVGVPLQVSDHEVVLAVLEAYNHVDDVGLQHYQRRDEVRIVGNCAQPHHFYANQEADGQVDISP